MLKVAINGLGRIGRAAFKIIMDTPELDTSQMVREAVRISEEVS